MKKKAKTTGEAWEPKEGATWYSPFTVYASASWSVFSWYGNAVNRAMLAAGLVCRTKAQAIRKARAMLRAAKETQ